MISEKMIRPDVLFLRNSQFCVRGVESDKNADRSQSWFHLLEHLGEVGFPGSFDRQQALERVVNSCQLQNQSLFLLIGVFSNNIFEKILESLI
jgi:hypothetical protein